MKARFFLLCLGATWLMQGCFIARYTFQTPGSPVAEAMGDEMWHHNGIFGLVEFSDPVRLDTLCPDGVAEIEQNTSFLNGLVASITSSLYSPQTVVVTCLSGARAAALTEDGGAVFAALPLSNAVLTR